MSLPVIDIAPLVEGAAPRDLETTSRALRRACREDGFFYVSGHGVDPALVDALESVSSEFFSLPVAEKREIDMRHGGRAWRGYFGVGDELTSGKPDWKEGLYFGAEIGPDHPKVASGTPLFGRNLFPAQVPLLRDVTLRYLDEMSALGHAILRGLALGLGQPADAFEAELTADPLILFRIFHYPELGKQQLNEELWSVGEHTDYGLLTILLQDDVGGLAVKSRGEWIEAPPVPGTFVCNLGDMLERMTRGFYRSTPHRVLNRTDRSRLSFPFFFDPGWDALVRPILPQLNDDQEEASASRWDGRSVHDFEGTYGDYILSKVRRVFPELSDEVHQED